MTNVSRDQSMSQSKRIGQLGKKQHETVKDRTCCINCLQFQQGYKEPLKDKEKRENLLSLTGSRGKDKTSSCGKNEALDTKTCIM